MRAYAAIVTHGVPAGLLFVGDGELRSEMVEFITVNGLQHVTITGFKNQTELPECYVCGDIFVLPARFETWGLVVNEAMVFGLPVIASDGVGAAADLVESNVTGLVYPVGDVKALTAHLRVLVESPGLRSRMGSAAQQRVGRYDYVTCASGIAAAVQEVSPRYRAP